MKILLALLAIKVIRDRKDRCPKTIIGGATKITVADPRTGMTMTIENAENVSQKEQG